jgi:hypothetical protein
LYRLDGKSGQSVTGLRRLCGRAVRRESGDFEESGRGTGFEQVSSSWRFAFVFHTQTATAF